jgi:hypothetical protein
VLGRNCFVCVSHLATRDRGGRGKRTLALPNPTTNTFPTTARLPATIYPIVGFKSVSRGHSGRKYCGPRFVSSYMRRVLAARPRMERPKSKPRDAVPIRAKERVRRVCRLDCIWASQVTEEEEEEVDEGLVKRCILIGSETTL